MTSPRKKKTTPLLIPSIRFTKLIIHHLKTKHNKHPRTGLPLYYSHEDNILGNLRFVRKDGREVFGMLIPDALLTEHDMAEEEAVPESMAPKATKVTIPRAAMQTKPSTPKATKVTKPAAKRSKGGLVGKRRKPKSPLKLVDEFFDKGVPISEPRIDDEEADYQWAVELSLKDLEAKNQGPARTVVIREPDSRRF
ncbi:retrovirus-related pol polyprotein from transposon TNT 1-94 [Tanacetum coccineum]